MLCLLLDGVQNRPTQIVFVLRSANIVGSAQAQLVREGQIQSSHRRCFLGLVSFVSTIAFAYNQLHFNYGQYNKYNEFCAKEEVSGVNEKTVAQRSYKKAQGDEFGPRP